jgi:hypothetical protein
MQLPAHKCGLYLQHNEHRDYYQPAAEWMEERGDDYDWQSSEAIARAIESDSIWTLQWYPVTPVGCYCLAAPTLEELLAFAAKFELPLQADDGGK